MVSKSFTDVGISPGYGFKQLLYCPPANTLVVQAESVVKGWRPERLYFRSVDEDRYTPIECPYLISQENPVVAVTRPLLAYNTVLHAFQLDAQGVERHTGNWDSVRVFDLQERRETAVIDAKTLQLPSGVTEGWISSLMAFTSDDSVLHVVAALSRDGRRSMRYHVAELDVQTFAVRPLTLLSAVFM